MNKSAFVRGLPADMPAKEVVEKAKEAGMELSEKHVHAIRSLARRGAGGGGGGAAAPRGPGRPPKKRGRPVGSGRRGRPPRAESTSAGNAGATSGSVEKQLVGMVLDHGLRRIEAALEAIRQRLRSSLV